MSKGKWTALVLLVAALALGMPRAVLAQAQSSDGTGNVPAVVDTAQADGDAKPKHKGPPALEDSYTAQFGIGCVGTAAVALAGTYLAGPSEATMLLGGGLLVPSNTLLLTLSLMGQIGAASCAIGVTAAPTVLWAYGESDKIWAKIKRDVSSVGQQVAQTTSATGSAVLSALGVGGGQTEQLADSRPGASQ
jgi:hypothetical protein